MALTIEEICIRKIEGGIRSINLGTKKPMDVKLNNIFDRLKDLNDGMHDELYQKYVQAVKLKQNVLDY